MRRIYRCFVLQLKSEAEIAAMLNSEGIPNEFGRPWTRGTIHQILTNEKYVGNNVYNRVSFKLKQARVINPPDRWVRADHVFDAVIDSDFFLAARRIVEERSKRLTNEEMLERLTTLLKQKGHLSGLVIDEMDEMPSSSVYRTRFGSLIRAYQLVGYDPGRDYQYIETNRALRTMFPDVLEKAMAGIRDAGGTVEFDELTDILTINGEFTASIVIARCLHTPAGFLRWKLRLDTSLRPDITIAIRMDGENKEILDYYLLPSIDMSADRLRLAEENGIYLDAYRFDDLDALFGLSARNELGVAA